MKNKLLELQKNAYSPYFNYKVAAIVVCNDGKCYGGVNVENANGTSICAERNAIAAAVAAGHKKGDFKEINIMCDNNEIGMPCFACRQVMLEFLEKETPVKCYSQEGKMKKFTVSELCPYPFELN